MNIHTQSDREGEEQQGEGGGERTLFHKGIGATKLHIFGRVAFGERQPDVLRGTVTVRKDDAITFMSVCSHWKKLERSFSCLFVQLTLIAAVRTGVYIYILLLTLLRLCESLQVVPVLR